MRAFRTSPRTSGCSCSYYGSGGNRHAGLRLDAGHSGHAIEPGGGQPRRVRNGLPAVAAAQCLVVVQVTVCSLLLISAAISLRSERRMASQEVGFDPRGGFSVQVIDKLRVPVAERLRAEPRIASVSAFREFAYPPKLWATRPPLRTQ